ncbi:ATP-binding cassette domain-containing protein [Actinocrispum wychmicini]|uniref:UvrABC system protein A n=1 Tax=Actinocrispum wychmicini TaxID=1213861 RepID=A0A4R2J075_9PSEU|nr:excinuclease ABC subunit UvrA [Actinocrispum wychmicini]TCO50662.1 excinuclease UvrABC ATPase subunit [Actinocrispum wychmicini]
MDQIRVTGARQHNLRGLTLTVPRRAITVFTGVSGSGKTSLVFDTIAAEAQRQLNETFPAFVRHRLPSYGRPDVDAIENLSPVVVINQRRLGGNARSTVGTITDIQALLRLLFSRAGEPRIGESTAFSFNDPAGMCPRCSGIGRVVSPDVDSFVDVDRSLTGGAILLPGFSDDKYWYRQISDRFDTGTPLRRWSAAKRRELDDVLREHFTRIYIRTNKEVSTRKQAVVDRFTTSVPCPDCDGTRLNEIARSVRVNGYTIAEYAAMQISSLVPLVKEIDGPEPVVTGLVERLDAMVAVGLGYLSLDRATPTLSGGESQRVKMVRHLGSSLTEMLYVFDEPSTGLHPRDVTRLTGMLRQLRDKGNTILVVEHDPDIVQIADHVVDLGPGAGADGGRIVFQGTVTELADAHTATALAVRNRAGLNTRPRRPTGEIIVANASRNNLRDVTVGFPTEVLTVVTGVAGSGKSSLVSALVDQYPGTTVIDQSAVSTSRRSSTATYTGIAEPIRRLFARVNGVSTALFSANSAGACPDCRGLGVVDTDLAFMDGITTVCGTCHGQRFTDDVLKYTVDGYSIADVLDMTVDKARAVFDEPVLTRLVDVGLGYLTLGQPLSTLSGGECQRLKLAGELGRDAAVYVLDEPTTGLHPVDVERLLGILDRLVRAGNTVIVVEHDLDVIRRADWVIDLGPDAGDGGGHVIFTGTPSDLVLSRQSITAAYVRADA